MSENQGDTLKDATRLKKGVTLSFPKGGIRGDHVLLLTPPQINRLDRAHAEGRRVQIRLSAMQLAKDVSYIGGFLGMLSSLVARALPTLLTGLGSGNGLFLQKHGKCYQVQKCKGDGLYPSPHPPLVVNCS